MAAQILFTGKGQENSGRADEENIWILLWLTKAKNPQWEIIINFPVRGFTLFTTVKLKKLAQVNKWFQWLVHWTSQEKVVEDWSDKQHKVFEVICEVVFICKWVPLRSEGL